MKVKCDYCGSFIEDTDETCPNCGAVNSHLMRSADGVPKTIEELKAFAKAKNLPLEEMALLYWNRLQRAESVWHIRGF